MIRERGRESDKGEREVEMEEWREGESGKRERGRERERKRKVINFIQTATCMCTKFSSVSALDHTHSSYRPHPPDTAWQC